VPRDRCVRLHSDKVVRIHTGKADYRLLLRLEDCDLATPDAGPEWWLVEAEVARRYMAALAQLLASVEHDDKSVMDPVTDREEDLEALGRVDTAFATRRASP
jgi:tRNA U34 5-carboxymethylaminomethyl modifying enzyme MnmG/GidA